MSWAEDVTVGDLVLLTGSARAFDRIVKVARATKVHLILESSSGYDPVKINRRTGNIVGSSTWSTTFARRATKDDADRIRRQRTIDVLTRCDWRKLSDPALRAITRIVKEEQEKEEANAFRS